MQQISRMPSADPSATSGLTSTGDSGSTVQRRDWLRLNLGVGRRSSSFSCSDALGSLGRPVVVLQILLDGLLPLGVLLENLGDSQRLDVLGLVQQVLELSQKLHPVRPLGLVRSLGLCDQAVGARVDLSQFTLPFVTISASILSSSA